MVKFREMAVMRERIRADAAARRRRERRRRARRDRQAPKTSARARRRHRSVPRRRKDGRGGGRRGPSRRWRHSAKIAGRLRRVGDENVEPADASRRAPEANLRAIVPHASSARSLLRDVLSDAAAKASSITRPTPNSCPTRRETSGATRPPDPPRRRTRRWRSRRARSERSDRSAGTFERREGTRGPSSSIVLSSSSTRGRSRGGAAAWRARRAGRRDRGWCRGWRCWWSEGAEDAAGAEGGAPAAPKRSSRPRDARHPRRPRPRRPSEPARRRRGATVVLRRGGPAAARGGGGALARPRPPTENTRPLHRWSANAGGGAGAVCARRIDTCVANSSSRNGSELYLHLHDGRRRAGRPRFLRRLR